MAAVNRLLAAASRYRVCSMRSLRVRTDRNVRQKPIVASVSLTDAASDSTMSS